MPDGEKGILYATVSKWSEMDFTPFDNSEITTLEEHIKRKMGGYFCQNCRRTIHAKRYYQPDCRIVAVKVQMPESGYLSVYDPTCGGGNLLLA